MQNLFDLLMIVVFALLLAAICSLPVWLLWNWFMPTIFGLKSITFMQAFGLTALCDLLFKSPARSSSK